MHVQTPADEPTVQDCIAVVTVALRCKRNEARNISKREAWCDPPVSGGKKPPQVVVITGASTGVGRATAIEFAKHGAKIGLLARGRSRLEAAQAEIESGGGQALGIPTDVADAAAVERADDEVERKFGTIDIWVNNAMTTVFSPVQEITPDEFKRATEVTYLGTVYGTMAALARMLSRDRGCVVQVGSALAYRSIPLQSPYCGAKTRDPRLHCIGSL